MTTRRTSAASTAVSNGIGMGTALAMIISWSQEPSVLWTIIHGLFGWLYVIFHLFTR